LYIRSIYHYVLLDLLRIDQHLDYKIHIYQSLHICRRLNKCHQGMYSHQLVGLDNTDQPLVYHTSWYMTLMFCRRNHHHIPMLERTKKINQSNYSRIIIILLLHFTWFSNYTFSGFRMKLRKITNIVSYTV
jgi:hypothetical protein